MSYSKLLREDTQIQRVVILTGLGTLFHWYDFYIISLLFPFIFSQVLGYTISETLLLSLIVTGIGFVIRPLAAIWLSPRIDTIGRKSNFLLSLNLISLSAVLVGLFPYSQFDRSVGFIVILLARILQGVALVLDYSSSISYIYEYAPDEKKGYFTSLLQTTPTLGFLCSLICYEMFLHTSSAEFFLDIGWRLPLLLGLPLFVLALVIRRSLAESPAFIKMLKRKENSTSPLKDLWNNPEIKRKVLLLTFAVSIPQGISFYMSHIYIPTFLGEIFSITVTQQHILMICLIALTWPTIILIGKFLDESQSLLNFKKILLLQIFYYPVFFFVIKNWMHQYNIWYSFPLIIIFYVLAISLYALVAKILAENFPIQLRGTAISIPYHLGNGFFGGIIFLISFLMSGNPYLHWILLFYSTILFIVGYWTIKNRVLNPT